MNESTTPTQTRGFRRRLGLALGAGLLLVGAAAATASAKEVGSGAGTGVPAPAGCQPVTALVAKGDPKVGELGTSSIAVTYSVKPCTNGQVVTVSTSVSEYFNPTAVVYTDANAPLNGKFTAFGVRLSTSYRVTVSVYDAATSQLVGELSTFAAAVPRGV